MLRAMLCYAVLQILCTRVEGCHGDRYLDYVSYDLSKHPQVCSLDTWGSQRKKLLSYTKHLVSQEWIVNLSQTLPLRHLISYKGYILAIVKYTTCHVLGVYILLIWLSCASSEKSEPWIITGAKSVTTYRVWVGSGAVTQVNRNHYDLSDLALQK